MACTFLQVTSGITTVTLAVATVGLVVLIGMGFRDRKRKNNG